MDYSLIYDCLISTEATRQNVNLWSRRTKRTIGGNGLVQKIPFSLISSLKFDDAEKYTDLIRSLLRMIS